MQALTITLHNDYESPARSLATPAVSFLLWKQNGFEGRGMSKSKPH